MNYLSTAVGVLCAVIFLSTTSSLQARTWTQASTGKTIEGELLRVNGDTILINRGGKSQNLPIKMLSEEDKKFITEWSAKKAGGDTSKESKGSETTEGETAKMEIPEGETELVLSGAHLCCGACVKGAEGAAPSLTGVTIKADRKAETITITAETGSLAKTALSYLMSKGFYGAPSNTAFADTKKYKTDAVETLTVSKLHLCCGGCIDSVEEALEEVDGLKDIEGLAKGVKEFTVTGEMSAADVIAALHGAGMHGGVK